MLFVLGTGLAQNFATVAICRFLAGAVGGASLVLIEGTFADVWSASVTGRYYAVLTLASYFGAACGKRSIFVFRPS
jgi:DHA1 family multidrug resistance protein-like MFS transporter